MSHRLNFTPVANRYHSYSASFTLIELLVVVAIIGVLAGMIVLGLNGAKERAQIAKGIAFSDSLRNSLMLNLISEWKFDENQGTTAHDTWAKYNPNNGTLVNGPVWKSGSECVSGSCLQFDGVDDYVDCGNNPSLNITDAITIEAWIKNNGQTTYGVVVSKWGNGGTYQAYDMQVDNGHLYSSFDIGGADNTRDSGITINDNVWHHVVVTFKANESNNQKMYVDGVLGAQYTTNAGSLTSRPDIHVGIGRDIITDTGRFNGLIDEVRIYNAALPSTQIKQHYVQGLQNLLVNKAISYQEYSQRMAEINQGLAKK